MEVLIKKIADAVYSPGFTAKETNAIKKILSRTDCCEREKATCICDLLGIERRLNRVVISAVLAIHELDNIKTQLP